VTQTQGVHASASTVILPSIYQSEHWLLYYTYFSFLLTFGTQSQAHKQEPFRIPIYNVCQKIDPTLKWYSTGIDCDRLFGRNIQKTLD